MKLRACDIAEFIRRIDEKEVVCWGSGYWLTYLSNAYNTGIEDYYSYVVDTNPETWGTKKKVGNKVLEIRSPQYLYDNISANTVLLITFKQFFSLYEELNANPKFDNVECYASTILNRYENDKIVYSVPPLPDGYRMNKTPQIPKIIHYIWFGGKPIPEKFKAYIDSWHKYCPDYEIKEWNESNYDVTAHPFMRETTAANRPGFTADYARLDIIYKHGGVYLDVDVELVRNIDELLYCSAFCGFHTQKHVNLGTGFGARKHHPMVKAFRDAYDLLTFAEMENPKSTMKYTTSLEYQTQEMLKYGLCLNGEFQIVNDTVVLPAIYLNAFSIRTRRFLGNCNTYSIHHFGGSWLTEDELDKQRKDYFFWQHICDFSGGNDYV